MKRIVILIMGAFAQTILSSQTPFGRPTGPTQKLYGTLAQPRGAAEILPISTTSPLSSIGQEQEQVPKLTIDLIPPTENINRDIEKKLRPLTLYTSAGDFLINTLEKQDNAAYWMALAYLQQVGSAYQWQNSLDEQEFQQEIDRLEDIISFNYANTQIAKMSLGKQELYLNALIKAMDYILNPAARDWRNFLNNTTKIQMRRPLSIGGIRFSDSLASALNSIKDEYSKLQASRDALEKDLQEITSKKPVSKQQPVTTAAPTTTTTQAGQISVPLTPQTGALVPYVDVTKPRPTPGVRPTPGRFEEYEEVSPARVGTRPAAQPYSVSITTAIPINIIPLATNKTQVQGKLEQLRELHLDSGNISMSIEDLQEKDDANYWLALAFLQRVASAYAQWKSNKLSEQEKSQFKDIADFGYWFSVTEAFDDAWLWQAIIDAIFYIQHPNNQGWNAFLTSNKIKLSEGLMQNLKNIRAKFDDTLNRYKTYAAILASSAQNNVYNFAEQFLQAIINLKLQGTSGKKVSNEELEKARDIFASLLEEVNKNKVLEAELTKAKWELRNANIGFDRYLDRKNIKEDLQSNKILLDKMVKPKEAQKEVKKMEERKQPGIIPVPVPVPIKGRRAQEQVVADIERPQPLQPAIEQPVQPTPEPVAIAQPQPEPVTGAPAVISMPEIEAPIAPSSVPPAELPAPSLEISPIPGMEVQTRTLSNQELVERWQAYNKEMRTKRTVAEIQEFIDRLENEKQLIETQPYILERAKDQLLQLQEQENEMRRLQGLQMVPYTGKPTLAPEIKQPRYTLAPGAQEMLEGKKEEQRMPEWQQRMMEEQERIFTQRLNEQLRQQLEREQIVEPATPKPAVTVLPSAPISAQPPPVIPASVEQKPKIYSRAEEISAFKPVKKPAPVPVQVAEPSAPIRISVPVEPVVQSVTTPIVQPTISSTPIAPAVPPQPISPQAEQIPLFTPRPTAPAPTPIIQPTVYPAPIAPAVPPQPIFPQAEQIPLFTPRPTAPAPTPIVQPTVYSAPVAPAVQPQQPPFPRAEQIAQMFKPRPTVPAPTLVAAEIEPEIAPAPIITPPVVRPTAFAAAAALGQPAQPISAAAQTAMAVAPAPITIPAEPKEVIQAPVVAPAPAVTPVAPPIVVPARITAQVPTDSENIIVQIEQVLKNLKETALPAIREKSKDKDTQELAKVFLQQALQAYELYMKYQPLMKRQQVLIDLRDWIIFFNQLEQAYVRARESYDTAIAAAYFEALTIAIAGKTSGWFYSTAILTKEQEPLFQKLKKQFAKNIAETEVLLRIAEGAAREGEFVLKSVWEFITSLIVVVKDDENYPQERKAAADALLRLLPLVDSTSASYNEDIENALHTARKALLAGFKSSQSDTYPFYLSIIHTSGDESRVYDDIRRALNKLNIPPPTRTEQEKRELTQLIKNQDPRAITKLQEMEQLPADVKKEIRVAIEHMQPAYQEKLATIYTDVIEQEAQTGNIAQAQALVKQASTILPAQQSAILAQVQPIIATAQRKETEVISAQTAQIIPALQPLQGPTLEQPTIIQLQAPVQPAQPISPEELSFLGDLNENLTVSNEIIARVLDIFKRADALKDRKILITFGPMLGRMIEKIQKLKQPALDQLDQTLITQLRTLWTTLSPKINPVLQAAERAKVKKDRLKKIAEFEQQIARRASIEELRAMVPELNMMMILGPNEVKQKAEQVLNEVEKRLEARTRWVKPV